MDKPVMHIDRPVAAVEQWTDGRVEVVGPGDERLAEASAVIVGGIRWDAARFDLAPQVKVLARTGIGVDAVDLDEATRRGVLVANTPEGPTVSTAEHAMALLFTVAKTIGPHQERLRQATGDYAGASTATELDGLTIGLLAYGRIARRTARIAAGIGMRVLVTDPYLDQGSVPADDPASPEVVDFDELLSRSDVLSLHAPLTDETARIMDAEAFARCRPGVIFINAARGGLVDHDALVAALDSGQVRAAGLDVTEPEPLDPSHTLLHRDNVVVTPHIASSTEVGRDRMLSMAIDQALQALSGERPSHLVNEAVWPS
ncbi:MAG: NAD(P)-dependent oxidoreductase [Actinomycetota bacterium]